MKTEIIKSKIIHNGISHVFQIEPSHVVTAFQAYYICRKMIVGVSIDTGKSKYAGYWKGTGSSYEVLLTAIYNGYEYRTALKEYKSERSLVLRINNFIKNIIKQEN